MNPNDPYKKIFARIELVDPSDDLCRRIEARICHARIIRSRIHATFHVILSIGTFIIIIPVIRSAFVQATQSGLFDYLSLIVSDGSYLISSWRQTTLSILESVPIMSIALSLGILIIFTNSLRRGTTYIRSAHVFKIS